VRTIEAQPGLHNAHAAHILRTTLYPRVAAPLASARAPFPAALVRCPGPCAALDMAVTAQCAVLAMRTNDQFGSPIRCPAMQVHASSGTILPDINVAEQQLCEHVLTLNGCAPARVRASHTVTSY
jgi:hypothetical protein